VQDYSIFPIINAVLNGTSALLIAAGIILIRRRQQVAHKRVMLAAVVTSSLFLISYLYYHVHVGSVRFQGHGYSRPIYFAILASHTILAALVVPLVLVTLTRALRGRFDTHRASARWTYPVWLYVSVTGVVIYIMLYRLFPS
jgi:putative membrane protein